MLFESASKLLAKDGGIGQNSMYYMLCRVLELKGAIEKFQRCQTPSASAEPEPEPGYSFREDRIRPEDWDVVLKYLVLLRPF